MFLKMWENLKVFKVKNFEENFKFRCWTPKFVFDSEFFMCIIYLNDFIILDFTHFSHVVLSISSAIVLIWSRLITFEFIHCLRSSLYDCNYFSAEFNWGVCGGILIYRTSSLLINFLNSWLRWSDELSNIKHVFLFQLFKCIFESFTSLINNQNDLEIIEPVEANSASTLWLEIATIKDMLH